MGQFIGDYENMIKKSFATGSVYGWSNVGGLVGAGGYIEDCYSTSNVTGYSVVGGLVGRDASIKNCYSTGVVTGVDSVGGLLGTVGTVTNSYFLNTSGPDNGYGEPLTDEQMKHCANFVNWDFVWNPLTPLCDNGTEDIWCIVEGLYYPKLAWQGECNECFPKTDSQYNDWVAVGRPNCWCGKYGNPQANWQCYGDADNKAEGGAKYRVYNSDYNTLIAAWAKKATQLYSIPNGICADFDHKSEGGAKYRVYISDYNRLISNWAKKATQLQPWCPLD